MPLGLLFPIDENLWFHHSPYKKPWSWNFLLFLCEWIIKVNKVEVNWTYLMMKVSQMIENIDINEKDTEKRTNERTNERIEQKFHEWNNEQNSRNWRKSVFLARSTAFPAFLQNIKNCYQQYFMWKKPDI